MNLKQQNPRGIAPLSVHSIAISLLKFIFQKFREFFLEPPKVDSFLDNLLFFLSQLRSTVSGK